jgi:transcriptional regulator with XRE-family HTH domain
MEQAITQAGKRSWAERIGARARRLRKARRETLEVVARRAGLGIGALSDVENGKREARLDSYERLAKALDVTLGQLLGLRVQRRAPERGVGEGSDAR